MSPDKKIRRKSWIRINHTQSWYKCLSSGNINGLKSRPRIALVRLAKRKKIGFWQIGRRELGGRPNWIWWYTWEHKHICTSMKKQWVFPVPQGNFHVGSVSAFLVLVDPTLYLVSRSPFLMILSSFLTFSGKSYVNRFISIYDCRWPNLAITNCLYAPFLVKVSS